MKYLYNYLYFYFVLYIKRNDIPLIRYFLVYYGLIFYESCMYFAEPLGEAKCERWVKCQPVIHKKISNKGFIIQLIFLSSKQSFCNWTRARELKPVWSVDVIQGRIRKPVFYYQTVLFENQRARFKLVWSLTSWRAEYANRISRRYYRPILALKRYLIW